MKRTRKFCLLLCCVYAALTLGDAIAGTAKTVPFDISGTVTVTAVSDGDSLRSGKIRIRLFGIDAPERKQRCTQDDGTSWACGVAARAALRRLVERAPELQCQLADIDRYGRMVMRCFAGDIDLSAAMVRSGYALAYRKYAGDYISDENSAQAARHGIWAGHFQTPWEWRRAQ